MHLGSSRGSWHLAHPKRCVEFIRGYEQLFIKASSFFILLLRMELLVNQTTTPGGHLSYCTQLRFLGTPSCLRVAVFVYSSDLSSLKNLLPDLPTRLTSHQGYFQLCTQNRQGDDELELMNGSKTRRSARREQGLDQR